MTGNLRYTGGRPDFAEHRNSRGHVLRTAGPDRDRWPSRLVATADEDRLNFRWHVAHFMLVVEGLAHM
jgi:hypothetical protein